MRTLLTAIAFSLALGSAAQAADLTVAVRGPDGRPVSDAVVTVRPARGVAGTPIRFAWPLQVSQQNIAFNPYVLIVPLGSEVTFPNKDKVRHHVYSFSPAKRFELKLYGREDQRKIVFDKPGVVALGCNIHDTMIGYVYVVDTPFAAKTPASGEVTVRGLPAGAASLTVWSPTVRKPTVLSIQMSEAGARQTVTLDLRPGSTAAPMGHMH